MMMAALALAVLVYPDVSADVGRVSAYRWPAGSPPAPIQISVTREGRRLTIAMTESSDAIVLFQRGDGSYLLDGPIAVSSDGADRRLDGIWRRTVQGTITGEAFGAPALEWLPVNAAAGEAWPACWWMASGQWACLGVPLNQAGVVVAVDGQRMWSGVVHVQQTASLRPSSWVRLIDVHDDGAGPPPRLKVTAARPIVPAQRAKAVRVETAAIADVRVTPVEGGAIWITGDSSPSSAWIEIRSARSGPAYVPLAGVADGPPQVPVRILLEDIRALDATVVSARGDPAAAALVTIFRVIDPAPPVRGARESPPPRRVFAAEATADADGRVHVDGLGDAAYEAVAWHERFGRGSTLLSAGAGRVTIHLVSPGIARGRVLAGGKPAAGVDVLAVPDPAAFAAAEDPIDLKGGDARTGADGRFAVTLATGGGGELRVGGGTYAIKRVPLPRAPLPLVELGDIELGRSFTLSIALDQDPGCDVRATGPIGRAGLRIVTATRTGPGLFTLALPEEGSWEFGLLCGRTERALSPSVVSVTDQTPPWSAFVVR